MNDLIIDTLRQRKSYMTTTEVLAILPVSRHHLCRWVREGRMPAILMPNGYWFDPRDIVDHLEARQTGRKAA